MTARFFPLMAALFLATPGGLLGGEAGSLYLDQDYEGAYTAFGDRLKQSNRHQDKLEYGAGTAAYKAENFNAAAEHLGRAILTDDLELRGKAYYNLGNTFFRLGKASEDPEAMKGQWEAAIEHYEEAEALGGSVASNAAYNRELVQRYLDQLNEQENQEQPQDENQEQQEGEDQQEQEQEQEGENQEQQDGENEPQEQEGQEQQEQDGQDQQQQDGQDQQQQEGQDQQPQEGESQEGENQQQEGQEGDPQEQEGQPSEEGQEGEEQEAEKLGEKEGQEGELKREGGEESEAGEEKEVSAYELTPDGKLSEAAARALLESLEAQEVKAPFEIRRSKQRRQVIRNW